MTLKAPRIKTCPKPFEQLQSDAEGLQCLDIIRDRYQDDPYGFEYCATDIVSKLDPHFVNFVLTRPWRMAAVTRSEVSDQYGRDGESPDHDGLRARSEMLRNKTRGRCA